MVMTAFVEFPQDGHAFSASEVGEALAGLVRRDASGQVVSGVLGTVNVSAVPAAWKVEISRFTFVRKVGNAARFSGLSVPEQHDITPAAGSIPAGQARIDLVCWDAVNAEVVVLEGVPASSPVAPTTSLAPLARVRVNAGDGMVIAGQITPVFAVSWLAGAAPQAGGLFVGSAAWGYLQIPHGMPSKPAWATVAIHSGAGSGANDWGARRLRPTVWDITDTHIAVRYVREDNGEWLADASFAGLAVDWRAGY